MSLTAPYTNAMRVGQGFNTYTQEIRLENAVNVGKENSSSKSLGELLPSSNGAVPMSPPVTPDASITAASINELPTLAINGVQANNTEIARTATPSPPPTPGLGSALDVVTAPTGELPYELPPGPPPATSQSVTYSTRAIENVSDIMDALSTYDRADLLGAIPQYVS